MHTKNFKSDNFYWLIQIYPPLWDFKILADKYYVFNKILTILDDFDFLNSLDIETNFGLIDLFLDLLDFFVYLLGIFIFKLCISIV